MRLFPGIVQTIRRDRRHGGPGFPCGTNRVGALATYLLGEAAVSTYVSAKARCRSRRHSVQTAAENRTAPSWGRQPLKAPMFTDSRKAQRNS